jgi:NAD(P)-dependent dehydrogenase (short-subunit alcohol dehydrogenase family)
VLWLSLDATIEEQARAAAQDAIQRFGQIDVLVNNAGYGLLGAVEETSSQEAKAISVLIFRGEGRYGKGS